MSEMDLTRQDDQAALREMFDRLSPAQQQQFMQSFNNQEIILPYQFRKPENFGQAIGNVFSNLKNQVAIKYGTRADPQGILANQKYIENLFDMQTKARELKQEKGYRQWLKDNTKLEHGLIDSASIGTLESLYGNLAGEVTYIPGAGVAQTNLSTNQAQILGQSTSDMKEYEVVVAQIDERNKNLPIEQKEPIPSFTDYMEQKKVIERTPPAALQIYDRMLELNPELAKQTPEQQTELLKTIMRQGRDPDYIFAENLARLRGQLGGVELTPGQIELDKKFAATVESYENAGGYANSQRNYKELNGLIAGLLAEPRDGSSSISGRVVFATPQFARSAKAIDTKDQIDRIITQDLRQTLGAQFTQQEGERFVAYAYNIMLPPHINARRLARMRNAMEQASKAKRDSISYFKKNGTLKGFKGPENVAEGIYESIFREEDYADFDDKELAEMFARVVDDPNTFDEEFEVIADLLIKRNIDLGAYNVK